MIDIIICAWILWGIIIGTRTRLQYILGDIAAIGVVTFLYNLIDNLKVVNIVLETYKVEIVKLYLWLEPIQTTQINEKVMLIIAADLLAYILLVVFLLAAIAIARNIIASYSIYQIKGTIANACFGCLRNTLIIYIIISLLPESIIDLYLLFELSRDSLFFKIIR